MKELVRQIKAFEFFAPGDSPTPRRYELRVLPQPVHRYANPDSGLIDGAMFLISYGLNPELVLLVEANRKEEGSPEMVVWIGPDLDRRGPRRVQRQGDLVASRRVSGARMTSTGSLPNRPETCDVDDESRRSPDGAGSSGGRPSVRDL